MQERKKKNIKIIGILMFIILSMYLFWILVLQGYSMPIQHRVGAYSGEFNITLGAVREIVIETSKEGKEVDLEIVIYDENNVECWNKKYSDVLFDGKRKPIDSFEKGNPLILKSGKYRAECKISNETSYANIMFIEYSGSYGKLYLGLCLLITIGSAIFLIMKEYENIPIEIVYIITMLIMGVIYNYIMPPLGVPDEKSHLWEAYEISSRMMLQQPYDENGYVIVREDVYENITYLHNTASISEWYTSFGDGDSTSEVAPSIRSTVSTRAPYAYFAPALGITLARVLGCSGHVLLLMGRIFNLVFLTLLTALAIKIIPYGKVFYYILGTLPEVIYLFNSYSYDGMNLALCMLIVAYFLHLYKEVENIGGKELCIFLGLVLLMIPIKVIYIAFALLLLLLPINKVTISKKQIVIVCIAGIVGASVFLVINLPLVMSIIGTADTTATNGVEETLFTPGYVLQNKHRSLMVYLNTIFEDTNGYINDAFGKIIGSGRYTGMDCLAVPSWMRTIIVILMILGLEDSEKNELPVWKRFVIGGAGVFTYLAVLTSMFFAWTVLTSYKIQGIQGRYFLPIFVLIPLLVKNKCFGTKKKMSDICIFSMGVLNLMFAFLMFVHYADNYFM